MADSLPLKNVMCPASGFTKSCRQIYLDTENGCPKYVCLRGHDPNTGGEVDKWGCVDSFIPMLLIENSQMQRQTGAAVELFRNEMVKANSTTAALLVGAATGKLTLEG